MSLDSFIPEIWAQSILTNLNKKLVYAQPGVVNTDYEGDISQWGDTVRINALGRVSVRDYDPAIGLSDPDVLTSEQQTLLIDQQKEFNFMVGDIDSAQTKPKVMGEATREAAYALADVADQFVAGLYVSATKLIGGEDVDGGADPALTVVANDPAAGETNVYELLVDLDTELSKTSTVTDARGTLTVGGPPRSGRWVIVDPAFYGLLRKENRFVHADKAGDNNTLRNGEVGTVGGLTVMVSDNIPTTVGDGTTTQDTKKIIAGHSMAWSWAGQINKTEGYRPDKFFSDALRGLQVYGAKLVRPEALAVASVKA